MAAISEAGLCVGIRAVDGVVLAGEKKVVSELLDNKRSAEKMYQIDDHIACAVAGITADANILINQTRLAAQRLSTHLLCSLISLSHSLALSYATVIVSLIKRVFPSNN